MNRGSCLCGAVQFEAGPFDSMVHSTPDWIPITDTLPQWEALPA